MKYILQSILAIFLLGCSYAPSVPKNYNGPLATIKDAVMKKGPTWANIYYVESIDGNRIYNSNVSTMENSAGIVMYAEIKSDIIERDIPARKCNVV